MMYYEMRILKGEDVTVIEGRAEDVHILESGFALTNPTAKSIDVYSPPYIHLPKPPEAPPKPPDREPMTTQLAPQFTHYCDFCGRLAVSMRDGMSCGAYTIQALPGTCRGRMIRIQRG